MVVGTWKYVKNLHHNMHRYCNYCCVQVDLHMLTEYRTSNGTQKTL